MLDFLQNHPLVGCVLDTVRDSIRDPNVNVQLASKVGGKVCQPLHGGLSFPRRFEREYESRRRVDSVVEVVRFSRRWVTDENIVMIADAALSEDTPELCVDVVRVTEVFGFRLLTCQVVREVREHVVFWDDIDAFCGPGEVFKRTTWAIDNMCQDSINSITTW